MMGGLIMRYFFNSKESTQGSDFQVEYFPFWRHLVMWTPTMILMISYTVDPGAHGIFGIQPSIYRSDWNTWWKASQIRSTPTFSPNPWAKFVHFLARDPSCECSAAPRGIFEFHSRSRDTSQKLSIFVPLFDPSKTPKCAHILASRTKFKIRLGAPESIYMRGLVPKNEPNPPRRLGCGWGCYGFWWFSPYISLNSVVRFYCPCWWHYSAHYPSITSNVT